MHTKKNEKTYIHINCTYEQKARFIRLSRAQSMKLGDWALQVIEQALSAQSSEPDTPLPDKQIKTSKS